MISNLSFAMNLLNITLRIYALGPSLSTFYKSPNPLYLYIFKNKLNFKHNKKVFRPFHLQSYSIHL